MSEWVSVENEKPDDAFGNKIWAYYDGYQFEAEADEEGNWCSITGDTFTHWMPLPKPPKEGC